MPHNPAARVFRCETCDRPGQAGARGPLPRRHPDCQPPHDELRYRIRTAAKLAHRIGKQSVGFELDGLASQLLIDDANAAAGRFPGE